MRCHGLVTWCHRIWVRTILPSARYHLFSDIEVTAENFPSFLDLVESTSHIAPLVRGFTIRGRSESLPVGLIIGVMPEDDFLAENMSRVAPLLHNVIRLKIAGLDWDFPTLKTLEHSLVHAFETKIRRLELQIYRFWSFSDATNFICHFSNLRHLDLDWVKWMRDDGPYTAPSLRMLEPLTVHAGEFPQGKVTMLTWLHIQSPLPKLISATFPVAELISPYVIPSTFGETLQNLHFSGFRSITEEPLGGICILFDLYIPSDCLFDSISSWPEFVWSWALH